MLKRNKKILSSILLFGIFIYAFQVYSTIKLRIFPKTWLIEHHNYKNPKNLSKNVYIITENKFFLKFQKINSNNGDTISLSIPKGSNMVISLNANATIDYKWHVENIEDTDTIGVTNINFHENNSVIDYLRPIREGENNQRQNIFLRTFNKGNKKFLLTYKHNTLNNQEAFNVGVSISVIEN